MGLQAFERRLEQLVEGAFAKAFRSGVQPVEIGRRIVREVDAARTVGLHGVIAPNQLTVTLSRTDHDHLAPLGESLTAELASAVRQHARDEGYRFVGPVSVTLAPERRLKAGRFGVEAQVVAGPGGRVGVLVMAGGDRLPLGEHTITVGRLPECSITVTDPQVSRHHAEIRPDGDGYLLVDLGSTNGTTVNGSPVRDHRLADGDVLSFGATSIRFEAS